MNGYKVYSVKNDTRYNKLLLEISYIIPYGYFPQKIHFTYPLLLRDEINYS